MTEDQKQIIEINGIKLEVDMRYAKRIDQFKVGDPVKLLGPGDYSNEEKKIYPAVIIGFEGFSSLPTIIVAYLKLDYSDAKIKFAYINSESSKKYEIVHSQDEYIPFEKSRVLELMEREIIKKEEEVKDLVAKKEYFLNHFNQYFKV